jgi:hypothetical protein
MHGLKFVFTAGVAQAGPPSGAHRSFNASLKSPGALSLTNGSAYIKK